MTELSGSDYGAITAVTAGGLLPDSDVISELSRPASLGAALATRNTRNFEGCGIALADPRHRSHSPLQREA
jgi:hypothetical protein